MKGIEIDGVGGPEVLKLRDFQDPVAGDGEVVIKVVATAINRADTMQRQGKYNVPPGDSAIPGLECSGVIDSVGHGVTKWKVGDEVCALLNGGGYAEKVNVPAVQLLPIPKGISVRDAGGIPEVACTVWSTIFMTSHLTKGETLLIHGGGSGIGSFATQIAKTKGVRVIITAGSDDKVKKCLELGADVGINYKTEDFVERTKSATGGKGVDVILDCVGGPYLSKNVDCLAMDGRLFIIGLMGGVKGELLLNSILFRRLTVTGVDVILDCVGGPYLSKNVDCLAMDGRLFIIGLMGGVKGELLLNSILFRRLTVTGAALRARSTVKKGEIVQEVLDNVWPEIEAGNVKVVIDNVLSLAEASKSHEIMEASTHFGKILLTP